MQDKNCYIIAEIGQAADGSLGILHSYIDAVSELGVDAIKFQTHIAEAESSEFEPFRVKFSYEDETRFDYWKRMSFSLDEWVGIKQHCERVGLEFLSSPFSCKAVDLLEEIGVNRYKIGSGEVTNHLLLNKLAKTGKQIILSSGMSNYDELTRAIDVINNYHNNIVLMQCTSNYPVKAEKLGLNVIQDLQKKFGLPVGLSDHSGEIYPSIAAISLGSAMIEAHVVFDKRMFGPDSMSSLTLKQFKQLVDGVRFIEKAIANPVDKNNLDDMIEMKKIFEKSLCINKDLPKGHVITFDDLEAKKPAGYGILASEYEGVIGQILKADSLQWSFINNKDLDNGKA